MGAASSNSTVLEDGDAMLSTMNASRGRPVVGWNARALDATLQRSVSELFG